MAICKRSRLNRQLDMELLLLLQNVLPMPTAERPEKKKPILLQKNYDFVPINSYELTQFI